MFTIISILYYSFMCIVLFVLLNLVVHFYLKIEKFTTNQTDLNDARNVSFERESIA